MLLIIFQELNLEVCRIWYEITVGKQIQSRAKQSTNLVEVCAFKL